MIPKAQKDSQVIIRKKVNQLVVLFHFSRFAHYAVSLMKLTPRRLALYRSVWHTRPGLNFWLGVVHEWCHTILTLHDPPPIPLQQFLVIRRWYYGHKILDLILSIAMTSFMDDPSAVLTLSKLFHTLVKYQKKIHKLNKGIWQTVLLETLH